LKVLIMPEQPLFQLHWAIRILILILVLTIILMIIVVGPHQSAGPIAATVGLAIFLSHLTLAILGGKRFQWCWRVVVGVLGLIIIGFQVMCILAGFSWIATLCMSVVTAFSIPSIIFAIFGHFPASSNDRRIRLFSKYEKEE
jgi:hypothetical protein